MRGDYSRQDVAVFVVAALIFAGCATTYAGGGGGGGNDPVQRAEIEAQAEYDAWHNEAFPEH